MQLWKWVERTENEAPSDASTYTAPPTSAEQLLNSVDSIRNEEEEDKVVCIALPFWLDNSRLLNKQLVTETERGEVTVMRECVSAAGVGDGARLNVT